MDPEQKYLLASKRDLYHVDTRPAVFLDMIGISISNFRNKRNGRNCTNDRLKERSSYKKLLVYQPRYSTKRRGHRSRGRDYACGSKCT